MGCKVFYVTFKVKVGDEVTQEAEYIETDERGTEQDSIETMQSIIKEYYRGSTTKLRGTELIVYDEGKIVRYFDFKAEEV